MTTLTTPDGPSEVINARRTESLDAPGILKLVQSPTEALFGRVNVVNLIEKAVLAVTLSSDQDELLGHAAFFDYPNQTDVDQAEWEKWIAHNYGLQKCDALNSLFMHYFVAKQEYSHGCAREIVRTMFNAVPDLHYCFLVVPPGVYPEHAVSDIFKQVEKTGPTKSGSSLFVCHRHDHVPVLHVRTARVQDHDDLVPLFNRQSDMLKSTYGEYFLAELIEAQDENMKCIVAEVDGTAIGFMTINRDVNIDLLNQCFELGPFHGLHVPHDNDELVPCLTPNPVEAPSADRPLSAQSDISNVSAESLASKTSKKSGVSSMASKKEIVSALSRASSKSSHRGSAKLDDPAIQRKLSDGNVSLLSEHSDSKKSSASRTCDIPDEQKLSQSVLSPPKTPKPPSPRSKLPKRFVPSYKGASSAFAIQLFCIDDSFEMRSCDFMFKAFELFENCNFGVITVPHLVPEFPLLQQFVRITPRVPSTLSQELYVFSRAGLIRNFGVRLACSTDYSAVESLVKTLDQKETLLADLQQYNRARRDDDGTQIQAFVAETRGQIVGVAIVRAEEGIEYIRSHYNIEDFVYFNHHRRSEHGHLHHYALNPVFKHYSKHFLKELLRLGHKTCLYYPLYPGYVDKETLGKHTLVSALSDMVPVRSRRQIIQPLEELKENAPSERILKEQEMYSLNHINRKLTLEPKVTINARIVVVGASDVGVTLLETFAYCPHLRFNNLILISRHGLPGELPPDNLRDSMMASSHCYSQAEYAQMGIRAWVNVVYGNMTSIDRKKKHVVVNGNTIVPYDHLVLATGVQYQIPAPTEADINQKNVDVVDLPNSPDRRWLDVTPENAFIVNDQYEAAVALYWVETNILNSTGALLIYGSSVDTFSCIQALINLGLPAKRIVLVEPPQAAEMSCFNNHTVEETITDELNNAGVRVLSGYLLAQWNDGNDANVITQVTSASFTSPLGSTRLDCCGFFSYYKQMVDYMSFKAINDACLVFDGRLVIDANFHTNDVCIRGAGPLTKFQRGYHADKWTHASFNSKDVGIQLASAMLTLFDPTLEPEPEPPKDLLKLIPMYRSPKICKTILPGGFHYLHVEKTQLSTPLEILMQQNDYGREIITGSPGGTIEYFRLHINQFNMIETITCLSKKPIVTSNLVCLFGLHERFLNNLVSRYQEGLVKDLYSYFNEKWCMAIFHDRFPDFRDEIRELLITRPNDDVPALEEKVRSYIDEDLNLPPTSRKHLLDGYKDSGAKRAVETRLLSFLSYNYYHLTMYAKPGMV